MNGFSNLDYIERLEGLIHDNSNVLFLFLSQFMIKSIKSISTILFFVFCLSSQVVKAESKKSQVVATHFLRGLVRNAHTKKPINAVEIKTLNGDASATTNESGVFKLKVNS